MENLKQTIARNIAFLRRTEGMTQLQLAEKLNYSDKAVSKWESGGSVPDVSVLLAISELFGVSVDYLLHDNHENYLDPEPVAIKKDKRHLVIALLAAALVWALGTIAFVVMKIIGVDIRTWLIFIWCIPTSSIVLLVFNSIWGKRRRNYAIISLLLWSLITALFLTLYSSGMWRIFLIGIPGEIIILLWASMTDPGKSLKDWILSLFR